MKKIIFALALFLLALPFVYAGFPYDTVIDGIAYTGNDSLDTLANFSKGLALNLCSSINGMMSIAQGIDNGCAWVHQGIQVGTNTVNYTLFHGNISMKKCNENDYAIVASDVNFTVDSPQMYVLRRDATSTSFLSLAMASGNHVPITGWTYDGTTQDVQFVITSTQGLVIINGTTRAAVTYTNAPDFIAFGDGRGAQSNICGMNISSFVSYNGSIYSKNSGPDIIASGITYYNLTVGSGCESWNTDKNIACNTSIERPTIQFNTTEIAWCAISANGTSTRGINYTEMGSSRNCTGAASGEGTTEHLCQVPLQDELVYETSYMYISCKDEFNNMNKSGESTSGPLKLNVTSLDTTFADSIRLGTSNSLSNTYTLYTDQKIYARNSANNQTLGTFDKTVKKLSKIWAFNRIGIFDSHVNMFNITPVLYTLELSNKTSSNITLEVEKLINSTK